MIEFEDCIAQAQKLVEELWPEPNSLCMEAQMMQIALLLTEEGSDLLLAKARVTYRRRNLTTVESFITLLRVL